jgi:hypothetical protein
VCQVKVLRLRGRLLGLLGLLGHDVMMPE